MIINTTKEQLLGLVQNVIGVVEKRNTNPILANILFELDDNKIRLTATDTEIQIKASDLLDFSGSESILFTVPGKKLADILKSFPDQAAIALHIENNNVKLSSGSFKVNLYALPASQFPNLTGLDTNTSIEIAEKELKKLIDSVHFAMANQDARYFLNGMLLEIKDGRLRLVATDGHRMGVINSEVSVENSENGQYIIPRKAIGEISRLLQDGERSLKIELGKNALMISIGDIEFSCRLIDGKYPDYEKAIPTQNNLEIIADKIQLKAALQRALILADERRAAKLKLEEWKLYIESTSNEQDSAQEIVEINYQGEAFETGFNLSYLLDVLNVIESEVVHMKFKDGSSTCQITGSPATGQYMVSPMRI
jgi:DNA polymerase-3 subunit beta